MIFVYFDYYTENYVSSKRIG